MITVMSKGHHMPPFETPTANYQVVGALLDRPSEDRLESELAPLLYAFMYVRVWNPRQG